MNQNLKQIFVWVGEERFIVDIYVLKFDYEGPILLL